MYTNSIQYYNTTNKDSYIYLIYTVRAVTFSILIIRLLSFLWIQSNWKLHIYFI